MNNAKKKIDVATFLNGEISMPYFDEYYADQARDRQKALTKPQKSLGKLEDIAIWMAGWQRKSFPTVKSPPPEPDNCVLTPTKNPPSSDTGSTP